MTRRESEVAERLAEKYALDLRTCVVSDAQRAAAKTASKRWLREAYALGRADEREAKQLLIPGT